MRDPLLDVFSDSAETKDFSLSDGGDISRVALSFTREGIGVLGGGVAFKALHCFPLYVLLRPFMHVVDRRIAKAMQDSPNPSISDSRTSNLR